MAVATDRGKPQPRRAAERDVDLVLARSPINLANLVTLGRLLMIVPLVWLIATEQLEAAFWLFVAAGISDVVDGFIAKNFNAKTELGAILDPLADKALLDGIYLALAIVGWLPAWLAIMVLGRDLLIVAGVVLIRRRHPVFRAMPLAIGKINTFAQILLAACAIANAGGWIDLEAQVAALIVLVASTTTLSGAGYAVQAMRATSPEPSS
jgi:cardiolipin synthase (CMP-forming)